MTLSYSSRPSPFSVDDFSELVTSAFNLHDADRASPLDHPLLSFTPPSPASPLPPSSHRSRHSNFHRECDQHPSALRSPTMDGHSPLLSPPETKSRSRTITALRILHQVRTRASAFVLRSRALSPPSPSPPPLLDHLPLSSLSPTPSSSSLARALSPWSMVDLSRDRPRDRAESLTRSLFALPKRDSSPPPLPGLHSRSPSTSGTRSPTPVLRSFFDDSPARSKRAYTRPATANSATSSSSSSRLLTRIRSSSSAHATLASGSLPSFFDDSGYQISRPPAPPYSRPDTPTGSSLRVHTRLPPLRKSRSNGHGLKHRGHRTSSSQGANSHLGLGYQDLALWGPHPDMPSPFTHPRDAPPVPGVSIVPPLLDMDDVALPPPYVFERRGSATSTSTGSTRSSSSLSRRITNLVGLAFPSKMRSRGRSKLNLSISTDSETPTADSSPFTISTFSSPSTPSSPTSTFSRSHAHVYAASADGHLRDESVGDCDNDALAIGRVLTPEADPFAKADIAIPAQGTPRPPTPSLSRRPSAQNSPSGLSRTVTWDAPPAKSRGVKKTRNSLPASPVSTAYTFPSSCSVFTEHSPGRDAYGPRSASPVWTPNRQGPPSAWSSLTPPHTPPNKRVVEASLTGSSVSRSASQRDMKSPPSPTCLVFPLPPTHIPHPRSPPNCGLLRPPPSPSPPPVPPKDPLDRIVRAHKSLPPSPHTIRSCDTTRHNRDLSYSRSSARLMDTLACMRDIPRAEVKVATSYLGEPWSGTIVEMPSRSVTPITQTRPACRRRSVDSTSTITASPSSSALHEAAREWAPGPFVMSRDGSTIVEGDSYSMDEVSTTSSSSSLSAQLEDDAANFWSPVTSRALTVFYSARSSVDSGSRLSFETRDDHRTQSLENQPVTYAPIYRGGRAASAGPCA